MKPGWRLMASAGVSIIYWLAAGWLSSDQLCVLRLFLLAIFRNGVTMQATSAAKWLNIGAISGVANLDDASISPAK